MVSHNLIQSAFKQTIDLLSNAVNRCHAHQLRTQEYAGIVADWEKELPAYRSHPCEELTGREDLVRPLRVDSGTVASECLTSRIDDSNAGECEGELFEQRLAKQTRATRGRAVIGTRRHPGCSRWNSLGSMVGTAEN